MPPNLYETNRPHSDRSSRRRPGILIVDEMALVLVQLKLEFQRLGCDVWLASNGPEALATFKQNLSQIDVVILQVERVTFDGLQTLRGLREIQPDVRCCLTIDEVANLANANPQAFGVELIFRRPIVPAFASQAVWELISSPGAHDAASL